MPTKTDPTLAATKPATLSTAKPAPTSKEVPADIDPKSAAARAIFDAYALVQDTDGSDVDAEKKAYDAFIAAANAVAAATPAHPIVASLKQTAEYRATYMRQMAKRAVDDAKAFQKEVEQTFGSAEAAISETETWASDKQVKPFFSTFLENQHALTASKPKWPPTMKYPSDMDEYVTLKYPSDDDEVRWLTAASGQLANKPLQLKEPPYVTLKYPSDNDEYTLDYGWLTAPAQTTQWPSDDLEPVQDYLYSPQLVEGLAAPARTQRWPSEDDEYTPTEADLAEMQRTLDGMANEE